VTIVLILALVALGHLGAQDGEQGARMIDPKQHDLESQLFGLILETRRALANSPDGDYQSARFNLKNAMMTLRLFQEGGLFPVFLSIRS
jgi:hypothetical protein